MISFLSDRTGFFCSMVNYKLHFKNNLHIAFFRKPMYINMQVSYLQNRRCSLSHHKRANEMYSRFKTVSL